MPIQILSPDVVSKIAAGEVIERPASVVKELVENSLDAGARNTRVDIRGGGRQEIRVVDDGAGIPAAEVALSCQRHATSKLATAEDLYRVRTLGFRGEALASIAAVSHFTLVSRPAGQEVGMEVRVDGGEMRGQSPRACTIGTIVTVRDLFYNTPARLKFLRQPRTEVSYINVLVTDYALAHPDVAFHLLSEGRTVLRTNGSGKLHDALIEVHDLETARQMFPVEGELGEGETRVRVSGYASQPSLSRASRRAITLPDGRHRRGGGSHLCRRQRAPDQERGQIRRGQPGLRRGAAGHPRGAAAARGHPSDRQGAHRHTHDHPGEARVASAPPSAGDASTDRRAPLR